MVRHTLLLKGALEPGNCHAATHDSAGAGQRDERGLAVRTAKANVRRQRLRRPDIELDVIEGFAIRRYYRDPAGGQGVQALEEHGSGVKGALREPLGR